ncbi:hypothetical protein BZG36_02420 [Bifiguratus adelaidae]|uniref:Uncharacterized protein n=1 Tax=Bifiguratus adelaidae TaxID=1938954 RepID=A0A261Y190_9FUNG|nr:hypothetical protein BZG36_02420 [Bifiguratus adelaidae]
MANKATVKNVLSGDTVILKGKPRPNGPPPERLFALAGVQAPRLGSKDKEDELFAFASREYLRKLVVGKEVSFKPLYTIGSGATAREYGTLSVNGIDVATSVVSEGWAKVRDSLRRDASEEEEEAFGKLQSAEESAKAAHKGLWSTDQESGKRSVSYQFTEDARKFLDAYKGTPINAVIEQVRDASTLRVLLLLPVTKGQSERQQYITLFLSGIKAPAVRRDIPDTPDVVEPFGEEAKYFVESRLLQRGVRILLEGVASGSQNFIGTVLHPAGNIAEALLSQGLARCVDWSMAMVSAEAGGPQKLRDAERAAKEKRLRIWTDYAANGAKSKTSFDAQVIRIVSGDTILVRPAGASSKDDRRIQFSSIKQAPKGPGSDAPRPGAKSKDIKETGYQFEAREALRKKLIGKTVKVSIDYIKPASEGFEEKECATVTIGDTNIAKVLVERGLASVMRHRKDDDDRAQAYDVLLVAEAAAQEAKRGIWSEKELPVVRLSDASESAAKAKTFLNFLKRGGKTHAVVDHVVNGSRFVLWVPKENCRLSLVLSGIRAPRVGRNPGEKSEPYGQESLDYVVRRCLQRDVEIEVENVDKTGSFLGAMFIGGENIATVLLREGYAYVQGFSAEQSPYTNQLYTAERIAKSARKGVWNEYQEDEQDTVNGQHEEALTQPRREYIDVVVTEIGNGNSLYVQQVSDNVRQLEHMMSALGLHHRNGGAANPGYRPKHGELVSAKFTEDDQWYRAKVRKVTSDTVDVIYVDYGNSETLPISRVRPLPGQFTALPHQAQEAVLSFVKIPKQEEDYGAEANDFLRDLVMDRSLVANVDYRDHGILHLTLYDPKKSESADDSLNAELLRAGLAVLDKKLRYAKANAAITKKLEDASDSARRERITAYNDPNVVHQLDTPVPAFPGTRINCFLAPALRIAFKAACISSKTSSVEVPYGSFMRPKLMESSSSSKTSSLRRGTDPKNEKNAAEEEIEFGETNVDQLQQFVTFGLGNIWNLYQTQLLLSGPFQEVNATTMSFVSTLGFFFLNAMGLIHGVIAPLLGERICVIIGSVIAGLGYILADSSSQLWQLFLTAGLMFGMGGGLVFMVRGCLTLSVHGLPPQWFDKRAATAMGIACCGSGIGDLVLSSIATAAINSIGVNWSFRIMGFIILFFSAIIAVLVRNRNPLTRDDVKIVDWTLFKNVSYLSLVVGSLISLFGYLIPFVFISSYALDTFNASSSNQALLSSLLSGIHAVGRVITGITGDRFGRMNTLVVFTAITGLSMIVIWPFANNLGVTLFFVFVFAFSAGAYYTLVPPVVGEVVGFGPKFMPGLSMIYFFGPFSSFGANISSAVRNGNASYLPMQACGAVVYLVGAVFMTYTRWRTNHKLFAKV